MKTPKRPDCNCTNCDRSCYQNGSGVVHRKTTRDEAKKRLAKLRELVSGGAQ
jgi:hypothetical protein